jgi:hypothetical protein
MSRVGVGMNNGAPISGAVLTLILRSFDLAGRHRDGCPAFEPPARVVGIGRVVFARNLAPNGPIKTESGWWSQGRVNFC